MSDMLHLVLKNDLGEIEQLNLQLEEFGSKHNLHTEELYALNLCLEEIVTNIIRYAWPEGGDHTIDITVNVNEQEFKIVVEDDGVPFNPCEVPEPDMSIPAAQRKVGGLGIHLVRQSMDHMGYLNTDNKNVLMLDKRRKAAV